MNGRRYLCGALLVAAAAVPAGAQIIPPASLDPAHPLAPLAFLAGEWTGDSVYTPPLRKQTRRAQDATRTNCALILGNAYLRCHTIFLEPGGGSWQLEHQFRKGRTDPGIQARLFEEGFAGDWLFYLNWDEAQQAFVGEHEIEVEGQKSVERTTLVPAADRKSLLYTEELRLAAPGSPWHWNRRWTWTRRQ